MKSFKCTMLGLGIFITLFLAYSAVNAQQSVLFENISFEEAMVRAGKEGKFIFVDVQGLNLSSYNDQVNKEIFTADSVATFFNTNLVSIKVNMNSEEGKKFAPRLAMLMYPAYVFYDSKGDQLDFTNAASVLKNPAVLMEKARKSSAVAQIKMENKRSITFTKDSWKNLLAKAKKENKMIFLDAYTEWCRPCILMARDVFTLDTVADFYNKNFINVGMDIEKGEGPEIGKRYKITAYPAFLFIDGDGKLVSVDGGYQEADKFIKAAETALSKFKPTVQAAAFVRPIGLTKPGAGNTPVVTPAKPVPTAITFTDSSWDKLLAEAKRSGKLIFMDAYTTWCGPCKIMRATVFTDSLVGKIYNRNFVNAYIDMEKGEGIDLRQRYGVKAYPTFLYINGDGEIVHKTVGSCASEDFIQNGLDAISPFRSLAYLHKEYHKNSSSTEITTDYLKALSTAYENDKTNEVALNFLKTLDTEKWQEKENWLLIQKYVKDASSPVFQYLVKNRGNYAKMYGGKEVEQKIYTTYLSWPVNYLKFSRDKATELDGPGYNAFIEQVASTDYEKKDEILAKARLTVHMNMREWDAYTAVVNDMLKHQLISMDANGAELLYSCANNISRFAKDNKNALKAAISWIKISSEDIPQVAPNDKVTYMDLYASLLEETKQTKLAKEIRKKIDTEKLSQAQSGASQRMIRMICK